MLFTTACIQSSRMAVPSGIVACCVAGSCVAVCDCAMVSSVEMNSFLKANIITDFETKDPEKPSQTVEDKDSSLDLQSRKLSRLACAT